MNQTALDELCDRLIYGEDDIASSVRRLAHYTPPRVAGSIEDFEEASENERSVPTIKRCLTVQRPCPVVKPDWGAVCLLASIVLAGIGLLLVRMR